MSSNTEERTSKLGGIQKWWRSPQRRVTRRKLLYFVVSAFSFAHPFVFLVCIWVFFPLPVVQLLLSITFQVFIPYWFVVIWVYFMWYGPWCWEESRRIETVEALKRGVQVEWAGYPPGTWLLGRIEEVES